MITTVAYAELEFFAKVRAGTSLSNSFEGEIYLSPIGSCTQRRLFLIGNFGRAAEDKGSALASL